MNLFTPLHDYENGGSVVAYVCNQPGCRKICKPRGRKLHLVRKHPEIKIQGDLFEERKLGGVKHVHRRR